MQIYQSLTPVRAPQGSAVALGYFDGVHCGHRAVLGAAVDCAKANGMTRLQLSRLNCLRAAR